MYPHLYLQLCRALSVTLCLGRHQITSNFNPHGAITEISKGRNQIPGIVCPAPSSVSPLLSPPGCGTLGTPGASSSLGSPYTPLEPNATGCPLHPLGHQPSLELPLFKQLVLHRLIPGPSRVERLLPPLALRLFRQL